MSKRNTPVGEGVVQCSWLWPESRFLDPDGWEIRYAAQCGNLTRDPSGRCHRHRAAEHAPDKED